MKNRWLIFTLLLIVAGLILSACSATDQATSTQSVNVPLVGNTEQTPQASLSTIYPAGAEAGKSDIATSYPAASSVPQTDAEMKAFIEALLQGHHTLDFLLAKDYTAEEWVEVLNRDFHAEVKMTPEQREAVIAWLIKNKK